MSSYDNDLFYLCSLIEYIARKTHNTKEYVVNKIGKDFLVKIYNLAEVYHSENIDKVSDEIIAKVEYHLILKLVLYMKDLLNK